MVLSCSHIQTTLSVTLSFIERVTSRFSRFRSSSSPTGKSRDPRLFAIELIVGRSCIIHTISNSKPTIVFLGTYPPRECGIATFTQDLLQYSQKLLGALVECKVAALNTSPLDAYKYPKEVAWQLDQNIPGQFLDLAKTINADENISGVIIQHEYGIFGGPRGRNTSTLYAYMQKAYA